MKTILFKIFLLTTIFTQAKDSLNVKSSIKRWQLEIVGTYNYNYRKTGAIKETFSLQNDRNTINAYLDTGNIACYTKSFGILTSRKIWRNFIVQIGLIYGRKGYMYSRQLSYNIFSPVNNPKYYIKNIPETMVTIPFNVSKMVFTFKKRISFGLSLGCDLNLLGFSAKYKNKNFYSEESYLGDETSGLLGFSPVKNYPSNTGLLHEVSSSRTVPLLQYNLGVLVQVKIYRSFYATVKYNYLSQLKYSESIEYEYAYIPNTKTNFKYEIKPYIHSFGIGLGFEF